MFGRVPAVVSPVIEPVETSPSLAPVSVAPAPATTAPFLSRREMREAEQRLATAAPTPQPQVTRPEVFSSDSEVSSAPALARIEPVEIAPTLNLPAPEAAPSFQFTDAVAAAPNFQAAAPILSVGATAASSAPESPAVPSAPTTAASSAPWAQVSAATSMPLANPFAEREAPMRARLATKTAVKPKKSVKKKVSSFATIMAVAGFFASVSIPAIAASGPAPELLPLEAAQGEVAQASLVVDSEAVLSAKRESFAATTATDLASQRNNAMKEANFAAYQTSGAREQGDDYPWFSELSNNQGGGMSPLNYYYRECVDFVAWKLNVDAGSTKAPFKYNWFNLTPSGGNAYQWKYAWTKKGWPTSTVPVAGAVAWYSYGHIAYVKSVNADGSITVEDYNQSGMHQYDIRTVPANDAQLYLYPPPR